MTLKSTPLFELTVLTAPPLIFGPSTLGMRIFGQITGGRFEGPRLKGEVLGGGGDWPVIRADGSMTLDVRTHLRTDSGSLIYMTYAGRWTMSPEVAARLTNPETVGAVDPSEYYIRTLVTFETGGPDVAWLNDIVAVGVGKRTAEGVEYVIHAID